MDGEKYESISYRFPYCPFSGFIIFLISYNIAFNNNGETKLNLSTFRKIYKINPRKWSVKEKWEDSIKHLYYSGHKVKLSFLAFCYFRWDRIFSRFTENRKDQRDTLIWVLQDCQRDIEILKENQNAKSKTHWSSKEKFLRDGSD